MQRWQEEVGEGWSYFFVEDFLHDSEQQLVLSLVLLGASTMYSTCRGATNHSSEIIATDQSRLRRSPLTHHSSATIVTIINVKRYGKIWFKRYGMEKNWYGDSKRRTEDRHE